MYGDWVNRNVRLMSVVRMTECRYTIPSRFVAVRHTSDRIQAKAFRTVGRTVRVNDGIFDEYTYYVLPFTVAHLQQVHN